MITEVSPFCHASDRVVIVLVTLHELWKIIDFRFVSYTEIGLLIKRIKSVKF